MHLLYIFFCLLCVSIAFTWLPLFVVLHLLVNPFFCLDITSNSCLRAFHAISCSNLHLCICTYIPPFLAPGSISCHVDAAWDSILSWCERKLRFIQSRYLTAGFLNRKQEVCSFTAKSSFFLNNYFLKTHWEFFPDYNTVAHQIA